MFPGEEDVEEVEAPEVEDDGVSDDELFDFEDELPAGEGAFGEPSDGYAKRAPAKVALTNQADTDAKALLEQVRKSKKKKA